MKKFYLLMALCAASVAANAADDIVTPMEEPLMVSTEESITKPLGEPVTIEAIMYGGNAPDPTGIYRILKQMENNGLITSAWDTSESGPAKRCYELTDEGRACLRRWIDSLACYKASIEELRVLASCALGIEVPEQPVCHAHVEDIDL